MTTTLEENTPAPKFTASDQHGKMVSLSDFLGKTVVLFFYSQDNSESCTAQACNIRDHYREFKKKGVVLLGISPDTVKSHLKFSNKYQLPYTLIADEDKAIALAYKVYGEKLFFGKMITGIYRTTFVIDPSGIIRKIISKVKTKTHAMQILAVLEELQTKVVD